jgi:exosortase A
MLSTKKINYLLGISLFVVWLLVFYQGLTTAIRVWSISEIFTHCFFVIPISAYFIYQKRQQLAKVKIEPNYWLFIPFVVLLFLQTFGEVGDIRLFMHVATFTSIPVIIWMIIGNKAANEIKFPLFFILFSIPFGEQLIPFLQDLTTDIAVPLLEYTNVPIYRNGLYLEIPEGRFLVAEACSGISFLIASVVFGHLYAYLSFKSLKKQLTFIAVSAVVPIIANALRVYGIVLTGHLTDMEYAVGADHLIYGGVFYAIVLFILILIGEKFRDKDLQFQPPQNKTQSSHDITIKPLAAILILAALSVQMIWSEIVINRVSTNHFTTETNIFSSQTVSFTEQRLNDWRPNFIDADFTIEGKVQLASTNEIELYVAKYFAKKGDLISSLNSLYDKNKWTLLTKRKISLNEKTTANFISITSPSGIHRNVIYWYEINGAVFSSETKALLYETYLSIKGDDVSSSIYAFSIAITPSALSNELFQQQVAQLFGDIKNTTHE